MRIKSSLIKVFENKDLVECVVENLDVIEIQKVARTSKTFKKACEDVYYNGGLVLDAREGNLVAFLEEQFKLPVKAEDREKVTSVPFQNHSTMLECITTICASFDGVIDARLREIEIPYLQTVITQFFNQDFDHTQNFDALSKHTKKASQLHCIYSYFDNKLWQYLNFKEVTRVEFDRWFGQFSFPSASLLPKVEELCISIDNWDSHDEIEQEINLQGINNFPHLQGIYLTLSGYTKFPQHVIFPEEFSNVRFMSVIIPWTNLDFDDECHTQVEHLLDSCPKLKVFLWNPKAQKDFQSHVTVTTNAEEFERKILEGWERDS